MIVAVRYTVKYTQPTTYTLQRQKGKRCCAVAPWRLLWTLLKGVKIEVTQMEETAALGIQQWAGLWVLYQAPSDLLPFAAACDF